MPEPKFNEGMRFNRQTIKFCSSFSDQEWFKKNFIYSAVFEGWILGGVGIYGK